MQSISTHNLPRLKSFKDCEKFFEKTCLPKGWAANTRPLETARMTHKSIIRSSDRYHLMLYTTALVTYFSDGNIYLRRHDSQSSRKFLDRFVPEGVCAFSHKGNTWFAVETPNGIEYYGGDVQLCKTDTPGKYTASCLARRWCITKDKGLLSRIGRVREQIKTIAAADARIGGPNSSPQILASPIPREKALEMLRDPTQWSDLMAYTPLYNAHFNVNKYQLELVTGAFREEPEPIHVRPHRYSFVR